MALTLIQALLLCGALWVLWKFLEPFIVKTSLDNIPGPPSESFLTGNLAAALDRHSGPEYTKRLAKTYGSVVRLRGLFGMKALYVWDSAALHHIVSQDGILYDITDAQYAADNIIFGPGLLSVTGAQHRRQRKMLYPAFSTDSMRRMTPIFYGIIRQVTGSIMTQVKDCPAEVDVVNWVARAALEFIGQGGFGRSFDPLTPDAHDAHPVCESLKTAVPAFSALPVWQLMAPYYKYLGPPQFLRRLADWTVALVRDPNLSLMREFIYLMDDTAKEICSRSSTTEHHDNVDVMSILRKSNAQLDAQDRLPEDELLAQVSTILFTGAETTTSAIGRALYLLAANPDIQEKLREELALARDFPGEDISYDKLMELPFLEAVCRETLRVYPPAIVIPRQTLSDVIMPLSKPIRGLDGSLMKELPIPKGTMIVPSNIACNTAKDIWGEDALEWKPERWLSPLPATVTEARIPGVYSNIMSFSGGQRSCIGFRFAQLEMKVVLGVLLESFKFTVSDKEIFWNFSAVCYPTMDKETIKPGLVLKVEAVKRD